MQITITLDQDDAIDTMYALLDKVKYKRDLGDRLITGTNNRTAGFNSHDAANRLEGTADRLFGLLVEAGWEDQQ